MSEPWVHVGAPVLTTAGPFEGSEGTVDSIDPPANAVVVKLEVFGRPVPLAFPLSAAGEHFTPFGDQAVVSHCPHTDARQRDLLAQCTEADATFRTDYWWSATHAFVLISRRSSDHRLIVRSHNLTWPYREGMHWAVREVALSGSEWAIFAGLIEGCRFWELPHDDGRRIPRNGKRWDWRLEGYEGGRYHAVVRQASEPRSEILACCEYLRALAEHDRTDAEPVAAPDPAA